MDINKESGVQYVKGRRDSLAGTFVSKVFPEWYMDLRDTVRSELRQRFC